MKSAKRNPEIVIIYDGDCDFCKECVKWVVRRVAALALPFQSADLSQYDLTYERCSKEVVVIMNGESRGGAAGIATLLQVGGHRGLALLLSMSGPFGRAGYKWVAAHRNSFVIRFATKVLKRVNS